MASAIPPSSASTPCLGLYDSSAERLHRAYSGYVDVEARHLFFYFFESRNDPATDDVVMWINGGSYRLSFADNVVLMLCSMSYRACKYISGQRYDNPTHLRKLIEREALRRWVY